MAQLIDIQKVAIGPDALRATVRISDGAPLNTSEDIEGTARVYWLMPEIADHVCLGAGGETFKDVMGDTDVAHLMEHVTLELIARTNLGGDLSNARTRALEVPRTYEIELACPDDVLVASCLSSAAWILQWAYGSADEASKPNVDAIVAGIMNLVSRSYTMEGNEAPLPGTEPEVVEETVSEEVVERDIDGTLVENARRVVDDLEIEGDDGVRGRTRRAIEAVEAEEAAREAEEAERASRARFEADVEAEDELADFDLVLAGEEPDEVIEALDDGVLDGGTTPTVRRIGEEVGFMDLSDDDPLDDALA